MRGNERQGLLKLIIDLINELGPEYCYQPKYITEMLLKRGDWRGKETPQQTVASYFTDNPEIFVPTGGTEGRAAEYFLDESRRKYRTS
jgi:hypothetical protein